MVTVMPSEPIDVDADFAVIGESNDWIVVSKAAPLIVHPTRPNKIEPTLLGGVEQLLSYDIANGAKLSIINRLDRETSGLVLIAKRKKVAREFCRAMERRQINKEYDVVVFGWPSWDSLAVDQPLLRKGEVDYSPIWVKQVVHEDGRESLTRFTVVRRFKNSQGRFSLLRAYPHTGRMHQIRVHASYVGFPLVGDKIYGPDESCYLDYIETGWSAKLEKKLILPRQALHAAAMQIQCEDGIYAWKAPLARDLAEFLGGGHE